MDTTKELPTVISFCSGYGGIERGLDLAGVEHRVIAFLEIEAFAIANLVNKMETGLIPPAPIYTDLKTFPAEIFRDRVDIITGGYPCQPFSNAGERKGEDDPRHLWPFIRRHLQSIRPLQCFFENVEGHISLGLSSVISDLEEDGYRSAWGIFSAREVGAPHQRKRVYILGNSKHYGCSGDSGENVADTDNSRQQSGCGSIQESEVRNYIGGSGEELADTESLRVQGLWPRGEQEPYTHEKQTLPMRGGERRIDASWPPEPSVGRVVDGCANRVDRIRLLGNAVVCQTAAKAWITLSNRYKNEQGQ